MPRKTPEPGATTGHVSALQLEPEPEVRLDPANPDLETEPEFEPKQSCVGHADADPPVDMQATHLMLISGVSLAAYAMAAVVLRGYHSRHQQESAGEGEEVEEKEHVLERTAVRRDSASPVSGSVLIDLAQPHDYLDTALGFFAAVFVLTVLSVGLRLFGRHRRARLRGVEPQHLLLLGCRGTGKTTLLRQLCRAFGEDQAACMWSACERQRAANQIRSVALSSMMGLVRCACDPGQHDMDCDPSQHDMDEGSLRLIMLRLVEVHLCPPFSRLVSTCLVGSAVRASARLNPSSSSCLCPFLVHPSPPS